MRLLEIASAEEQIALWRLVSDNVWAALQLQRDQHQRAAVSTAARNDANPAVATKAPKSKSRGKGTKHPALKRVLRGYGKVPKLPSVPVPPKPGVNANTQTSAPPGAATAVSNTGAPSGEPATPAPLGNRAPVTAQPRQAIKPYGTRSNTPQNPAGTLARAMEKNQSKTAQPMDYRGGSGENTRRPNDQRPNGRQA
jgi:hypothetical protein